MEHNITEKNNMCAICGDRCGKLNNYNWLQDLPPANNSNDIVEIQFKNTRKGYYKNSARLRLEKGDVVAVEAASGHDIGLVSLTGELVIQQMRKYNIDLSTYELRRIYRKAKPADLEKWEESRRLESKTMLKAREIAQNLGLNMKIGDVEYQGDNTKAIFYYIADERVDFRELIKVLADTFSVRIEMRQIGARQEAGRIGGIGPCGRDLCCASFMTNFISVTTNAARYQEISLNLQKLAGQCGKLKCCLNYELCSYIDARKDFPDTSIPLETENGDFFHIKTDVYKRLMWYASNKEQDSGLITLSVDKVKEIIDLNRTGRKVVDLKVESQIIEEPDEIDYYNVVGLESITRFDEKNKKRRKRRKKRNPNNHNEN